MKEIREATVYHITSEPGDMTRYDYLVYRDGPDDFTFAPCRNIFRYPQRLNYWVVRNMSNDEVTEKTKEMASELGCNPYTLLECIRTVKELWTQ
jgi:hypothetical protein